VQAQPLAVTPDVDSRAGFEARRLDTTRTIHRGKLIERARQAKGRERALSVSHTLDSGKRRQRLQRPV